MNFHPTQIVYVYYRTESYLEKARTTGTQELNSKLDELHKAANEAVFASSSSSTSYSSGIRGSASFHTNSKSIPPPKPPLTGISGFLSAFRKEVFKDLGLPGK